MVGNMPIVGINVTLLFQMVNFFLLAYLFKKYLFKPLGGIIQKRREKIENELDDAEKSKKEALKFKEDSKIELKEAKIKSQDILNLAIKKAENIRDGILKEAHTSREKMLKAAEADLMKMKEQVKKELRQEMADIAIQLTEKMLSNKMDEKTKSKLIDQFIDEVGKSND